MAPETLSPILVLRRGAVVVCVARGALLARTGRARVVVAGWALALRGPLRRCINVGLATTPP